MFWGCMSGTSVRNIRSLKRSINAAVNQDVLDHFLIPYIEDKFGNNEIILHHDFAPLHAGKSTKELREKISILK